ncbi:MAG: thymidine kinase [Alphaproteobacteria bacterium]|jgi:thymidine kinase
MAKLYFYYSAMNAGKTTTLLQADFNYKERGLNTILYTAAIDNRFAKGKITSRIGLEADAHMFDSHTNLLSELKKHHKTTPLNCVLIDEAQFLTAQQVDDLANFCDTHSTPILCYGLRTDFKGALFSGSKRLLAIADELVELKTICACGAKATMNLRVDSQGKGLKKGTQTEIGGNESYTSMCRKHFYEALS